MLGWCGGGSTWVAARLQPLVLPSTQAGDALGEVLWNDAEVMGSGESITGWAPEGDRGGDRLGAGRRDFALFAKPREGCSHLIGVKGLVDGW